MQLSVVILNYNVKHFLEICIKSVQKAIANINAEIIVVDNASTDGSKEMMHTVFPYITYLYQQENVGFPKGNNIGVNRAKGEFICILNPDTAVAEDTFQRTIAYSESVENIGALGVYLMDGTGNFLPESKRNLPTPKVSLMKLSGFSKKYYSQLPEFSKGEVDVLVGAFMLLKRSVYNEVGGFDEDYFMYGEDIDLSYKITQAGYKNHYLGSSTVLHYKGESTQKDEVYLKRFYGAMAIFYKKHFNKSPLKMRFQRAWLLQKKVKRISANKKPKPTASPQGYYFFTENEELLMALNNGSGLVFQKVSKDFPQASTIEKSLLVFIFCDAPVFII